MRVELVGYVLPILVIFMIFILKLVVNESFSLENFKRVFVETAIDIMALGISFLVSYLITVSNKISRINEVVITRFSKIEYDNCWNDFGRGIITLFIYIIILIVVVCISKYSVSKYEEEEKMRFIVIGGICGYILAIPCLAYVIILLKNLGGV